MLASLQSRSDNTLLVAKPQDEPSRSRDEKLKLERSQNSALKLSHLPYKE